MASCMPHTAISEGYDGPVHCIKTGYVDGIVPHFDFLTEGKPDYKNAWAVRCKLEKQSRCHRDPLNPSKTICKVMKTATVVRACPVLHSCIPTDTEAEKWMKSPIVAAEAIETLGALF